MLIMSPTVQGQSESGIKSNFYVLCFSVTLGWRDPINYPPKAGIQNRDTLETTRKFDPYTGHSSFISPQRKLSSWEPCVYIIHHSLPTKPQCQLNFYIRTVLLFTLFFGSLQLLFLINVLEILTDFLMCKPVCFLAGLVAIYYLKSNCRFICT